MPTPASRVLARSVADASGCWTWTGYTVRGGYGRLNVGGRGVSVHRITYEAFVGLIPDGLEIDHLCRNRACVNPDHMEAVTHAENMARSAPARLTHCKNGHPLSGDNLYLNATSGRRQCRACMRVSRARYTQKQRLARVGEHE